jgi:iduronate 2-sulfatase
MINVPAGIQNMPYGSINGETTSLTSLMDIYPTLADLCNLSVRDDFDGISLKPILKRPDTVISRPIITTYDYGSYSIRYDNWHYIKYIDDSEELYNLRIDPEEWYNVAGMDSLESIKIKLGAFIPEDAIDLPEISLLDLQEHHVPPFRSREYYFSNERRDWMKRFE